MKSKSIVTLLLLSVVMAVCAERYRGKMTTLVRRAATEANGVAKTKRPGITATITTFIRIDGDNAEQTLADNGCRVLDRREDIFIVAVPLTRLNAVASLPEVRRIEASPSAVLLMDTTTTIVNALPVYAATALPQAYTGEGVVLGIMDVGVDLTHPNFLDSTLTVSRVKAFWDQLSKDTVGSSLPVGRDYTTAEDIAAKQRSYDGLIQTHGTHTLGIAAGNGYGSVYRGMAFDSEICAVSNAVSNDIELIDSADYYKYTSATDALGFKYLFDYADSVGKPCVASFSEGYTVGNDAEDSLFCEYLSKLVGEGRIIVASAGNSSIAPQYVAKPVGRETAGAFLQSSDKATAVYAEGNDSFDILLLSYGDNGVDTLTINSQRCSTDSTTYFHFTPTVSVDKYASAFTQGDTVLCITFQSDTNIGMATPLAVVAKGTDKYIEMRLTSSAWFVNALADEQWSDAETSHNVNAPGCFPPVVTVGATIHRTGFTNYKGEYKDYSQEGDNNGVRAYYSSIGPGTYSAMKPDVMAPGSNVVSSYSSFYIENNPTANDLNSNVTLFDHNNRTYAWNSNTGTSMSAPVVAGAIALWLQANPKLTPDDVKTIISQTARHPEENLDYPNNYYGHGEIDVYAGLLRILGIDGIKGLSTQQATQAKIGINTDNRLTIDFAVAPQRAFTVSVYALDGTKRYSRRCHAYGETHFATDFTATASAVYAVQITSEENGLSGSTLIRTK